jgi:hypothetical protein
MIVRAMADKTVRAAVRQLPDSRPFSFDELS